MYLLCRTIKLPIGLLHLVSKVFGSGSILFVVQPHASRVKAEFCVQMPTFYDRGRSLVDAICVT